MSTSSKRSSVSEAGRPGFAARVTAAAAALLLVYLAVVAARGLWANLAFTPLETEVSFWGRAGYMPGAATRSRVDRGIAQLLSEAPENPYYHALRAAQLAWEGYWSGAPEEREALAGRMLEAQYRALELRPADRAGWVKLVEYASMAGAGADLQAQAGRQLAALDRVREHASGGGDARLDPDSGQ